MMSKFYERRHKPQKEGNFTNYASAYFQKELSESSQYLVTPQERENLVALVFRANSGAQKTRLVHLRARKCSCLAFQDHKIPCRHAIAVCAFFNIRPEDHIAEFYKISVYREQYKFSLLPVLLDDLEPDGVTKPPPSSVLRGRPATKRMKRRTRETEARRLGNLVSSSVRREQQIEARNRYLSGTTCFQHEQARSEPTNRSIETETVQSHPIRTRIDHQESARSPLPDPTHHSNTLQSSPNARPPGSGLEVPLWERIRAIQASLAQTEAFRERFCAQTSQQVVATNDDVSIHNCTTQISITERRSQTNSGNIAPESCISHSTNDHSTEEVSEV